MRPWVEAHLIHDQAKAADPYILLWKEHFSGGEAQSYLHEISHRTGLNTGLLGA